MQWWRHILTSDPLIDRRSSDMLAFRFIINIESVVVNKSTQWSNGKRFAPFFVCRLCYNSATCKTSLRWRHNERDSVSNHQPYECLLHRLFTRRSKKTSKLRVTGLCAGNSPETGEFPAQWASNAENFSFWWRHHVFSFFISMHVFHATLFVTRNALWFELNSIKLQCSTIQSLCW